MPSAPEVHHSAGRQNTTGRQNINVCVEVPQAVIGCLLGSQGEVLKNLQGVTGCNIRIDNRYGEDGSERSLRSASISAREGNEAARASAVDLCARTLRMIVDEKVEVGVALSRAMMEVDAASDMNREVEAQEKAGQMREKEDELVSRVKASVGDLFSEEAIRDALEQENWIADRASDRLFNGHVVDEPVKPVLNMQKLLAATRAAKAGKQMQETEDLRSPAQVVHKAPVITCEKPSRDVMLIKDVFAKFHAKEARQGRGRN